MKKDKNDLIYDLLKDHREDFSEFSKEVREAQKATDEKLAKIQIDTSERLSKIEALDEIQNGQLAEHIRRTDILEQLHVDNQKRIERLEKPAETLKTMGKWAAAAVAFGAGLAAIIKLFI